MKKIYYLGSCDSCRKIMKQFDFSDFEKQEIKTQSITEKQLEELINLAGNCESLFSKKSRKYTELGLKDKSLTEDDLSELILSEYTFLKRPVIIDGKEIFFGSDKKNLERLDAHFNG
ncbi:MAG: ArsC/Spx/MgsR family protein [Moheibacter sp.]